ncbi:MAG: DUF1343 domain-containing protein [Thermoanaerobaculia bacterium]|nr:DUF1343 domain-containing protein [Thermoanaerobaculia bacterium]
MKQQHRFHPRYPSLLASGLRSLRHSLSLTSLALVLMAVTSGTAVRGDSLPDLQELTPADHQWVETTLAGLTLRQRAAQMIMVRVPAGIHHPSSPAHQQLVREVSQLGVGGIVTFAAERDNLPWVLDELQRDASIPLLVASDFERGASFRIADGAVTLPYAMALGATRSTEAARFAGELTAREGRSLGIHWTFAPVVDVNNNPDNPVINLRSFGEDPDLVGQLAAAFIEGAHQEGMLTAAKHFPGHGDTATDSHVDLPVLDGDRDRLDRVELVPFRAAIAAGVDAIMLGHLSVPALDPTGAPATLSAAMATTLLREELGFEGLTVTDGLEMKGLDGFGFTETLRRTVQAGSDLLLLPRDANVAIDTLVRGVEEGVLDPQRIEESVRRILLTKARLGLHRQRIVDPTEAREAMGRPEDEARAEEIAAAAFTVLRNEGGVLPLRPDGTSPLRILHLVLPQGYSGQTPERELRQRGLEVETRALPSELLPDRIDQIVADSSAFSHVLVSAYARVGKAGEGSLDSTHAELLTRLSEAHRPLIVVSYNSPYLLEEIPTTPVYALTYSPTESSQRAAVAALFGETRVSGKLPVTLPGLARFGDGLELPARTMGLPKADPPALGLSPDAFDATDRLLADYLARGAFPGGVLAVGYRGSLVHVHPFGRLSNGTDSPTVTEDTRYDLASLTKVIVTTSLAMMMVDEGRLDLDAPVASYLPLFRGPNKEKVTVRHLLTHSSGIDWWAPLHLELEGQKAYVERIQAMDLVYEPGSEMKYSDLGIILLGEILQRVSGQSLNELAEKRLLGPLAMEHTGYLPDRELWPSIAPTEDDPWRHRILQGEVHDENAYALGGVAPHAGLFGTAPDLARFAQMLLNRGVLEHNRLIAPSTVDEFTRDAKLPEGSLRALGWDTKSPQGSSAGSLFSANSYGHTGFTGTSLWIDPSRQLFVILLTNRVHPTRDNKLIREVRPAVADAVVRGIEGTESVGKTPTPVLVGLDRIAAGEHFGLDGKRIGLVVQAASVTLEGRHAIDVFADQKLDVVRLLSPEHGLSGQAAAGEKVGDGIHAASGLPVVSLYGDHRKPTAQDLADLDVLVFDLQGAGVRFYTYASTLIGCVEAAAAAGVEILVLDRPNPLGGERIEGPVSASRDEVPVSFVNMAPGPLVHGLTLGELAGYVNDHLDRPGRLTVAPLEGWKRNMVWADTGRPFTPPSPNLRSPEAVLAYPGVALLEATNVSEGRGTETPFLVFGAPWLAPESLVDLNTPGFALSPIQFTPIPSSAAREPKFAGVECRGARVTVADAALASPYRLGVTLLHRLLRDEHFAFRRNGAALTWLLGSPRLLDELLEGASVDEVLAAEAEGVATWREERRPWLLY